MLLITADCFLLLLIAPDCSFRRCAELWVGALESCRTERSPLSEPLAQNLHLGYVSDGFVNLGFAAMQLAGETLCWPL